MTHPQAAKSSLKSGLTPRQFSRYNSTSQGPCDAGLPGTSIAQQGLIQQAPSWLASGPLLADSYAWAERALILRGERNLSYFVEACGVIPL